ncbi:MAG: hypothetical protein H6727_17800 [Myxococcales bacterium]|nr:hypothetical protein [Myxococcales bacterium]
MLFVLLALYGLGMLLAALVGFCDASGRVGFIFKKKYYIRAVLYSILLSQLNWLFAALGLYIGYRMEPDSTLYLAWITQAGSAALWVYGGYTALVGLAFVGYAFPNTESRSFFTVAIFGPLTLLLPVVVLVGFFAAMYACPRGSVFAFFAPCVLYMMLFKRILGDKDVWKRSLPPQWLLTS